MAIDIVATPVVDGIYVDYSVSGLTPGVRYDLHRLQRRYTGLDDTGNPVYDFEQPDRVQLWSALAHRVTWIAPTATVTFRDYEPPLRAHSLFVVPTASLSALDWDYEANGDYDLSLGTLDDTVIHFNRLIPDPEPGAVVVRSTQELGLYSQCCVYDMTVGYPARVNQLAVMGRQYPSVIIDTREARSGTLTLKTSDLGDYYDLRRIAFPATGRIKPIVLAAGGDPTMMLDDMTVLPLSISIDQATQQNPDIRWVAIDYVEINRAEPLVQRSTDGDNDPNKPVSNFTRTPSTVHRNAKVTLADTSQGQVTRWDWTFAAGSSNRMGKSSRRNPPPISWSTRGRKWIKLRVTGPGGAAVKTQYVTVT